MKLPNSWLIAPVALLSWCWLTSASWAANPDALFPGVNGAPSEYDMTNDGDAYGCGNPGNIDPVTGEQLGNLGNPGILGERYVGYATKENGGNFIPGQISDYANWASTKGFRYSGNGPNVRHQFPIGRGGLKDTSSNPIAPTNDLVKNTPPITSNFDGGPHTFGFGGGDADSDKPYKGVTATHNGVPVPNTGVSLPKTSLGSCGVTVTDGW